VLDYENKILEKREMEIKTAKFIKGIKGSNPILDDKLPQVAFIGRSNVGKSSLINSLTRKKNLVKSSSLPGKTREINFFLINGSVYFVDLPGYGFAKIRETQREKLRKLILWYLFDEDNFSIDRKIVLIIDFKVGPSEFDLELLSLLQLNRLDYLIVVNKIDKISKGARLKQVNFIREKIGTKNFILYSAKTNEGRDLLLNHL